MSLTKGTTATLTFLRTTDATCATEITVNVLKTRKPLPLNTPAVVEWTREKAGTVGVACGMGVLTGALVVQ